MRNLISVIVFGCCFGLVKVNAVSALFISSNFSPSVEVFGLIDYTLAIGLILSVIANAGLPGAYPYFMLKLKEKAYESVFYMHGLMVGLLYLSITLICQVAGIEYSNTLQLVLLVAVVFALQILASIISKSNERIFKALMFEAGFFLILNAYNLYLYLTSNVLDLQQLKACYQIYLAGLMIYYAFKLNGQNKPEKTAYFNVLKFGFPLIFGALLMISLTGSARILIGQWIGIEAVGIYGIYFRLAALIVVFHQIVNIAFFKKIYTSRPTELDHWFSFFILAISLISILSFLLIPPFVAPYVQLIHDTWCSYSDVYIILCFQMVYWITLALFENVIYREKLSKKSNKGLFILFIMMIASISLIHLGGGLTLLNLVAVNTLALYFSCEWNILILNRKKIYFSKTAQIIRALIVLFIIYFIYQIL